MKKYKHSLANYPKDFLGYVVSPHKICIQFQDVRTTLRAVPNQHEDLTKLPTGDKALPIIPTGVGINVLAVGCEFPVLEKLQMDLISAYKEYYSKYKEDYRRLYGKDFKEDFLKALQVKLGYLMLEK